MRVEEVTALVRPFVDEGDEAAMKSRELVLMLLACGSSPFSRDYFTPGHITGTAVVLAPGRQKFLLVHHRRLDRWLLPGGHVEPEDIQVGDTARREAIEETGVILQNEQLPLLVGIDVHGIPAKAASLTICTTIWCSASLRRKRSSEPRKRRATSSGQPSETSTATISRSASAAASCARYGDGAAAPFSPKR